jgi:hypothetical protein
MQDPTLPFGQTACQGKTTEENLGYFVPFWNKKVLSALWDCASSLRMQRIMSLPFCIGIYVIHSMFGETVISSGDRRSEGD